jgi:hypothetical protein
MTQDDRAKMKLQEEYRAYLMATLPPIEEYASSSDEEEANPISSISKSVEESPPSKIHKRLPGLIEKWNSDVESDNEDQEKADNTKAGDEHDSENNYNESKHDDEEQETNYSSDSGSEALWGDAPFTADKDSTLEEEFSERFFGSATEIVPIPKKGGLSRRNINHVKVSSYVSVNSLTGQQADDDEQLFTASEEAEISGMLSQEPHSASSQFSIAEPTSISTASTVKVTQPKKTSYSKTSSSSSTTSSSAKSRSATSSSTKSSYFTNPPLSTSKIVTRARNAYPHEEDIGNNLDLYTINNNKKRKK